MVDALQLVSDVKEKFKIEHLVNILIGEADSAIKSYKHDKLELFGAGSEKSRQFWTMGRIENVLNTAFMTYSCLKKTVNVINDV